MIRVARSSGAVPAAISAARASTRAEMKPRICFAVFAVAPKRSRGSQRGRLNRVPVFTIGLEA